MHLMTNVLELTRYPLISEIKQLLLDSYYGREFTEKGAELAAPKAEKKNTKNS